MKKILAGLACLAAVLIIIAVLLVSNLGPIIKKAVNSYGPDITKTEVKLGGVDVSLFSGEAALSEFLLGNPEGYNTAHAMTVKSIYLDIAEKTVTKDTVVIEKIKVMSPDINYEVKGRKDNFRSILENIKKTAGAEEKKPPKPPEEKKPGKKILIRNFILEDGKVNLASNLLKKKITAPLPDLHLKNIGEGSGGTSPEEAFKIIFDNIYRNLQSPAVRKALEKQLEELGKSLEGLGLEPGQRLNGIKEKAKDKLDSVKDAIEDTAKGLFGN